MAPPQSTKPLNPNWGGRREGSGRKKRMLTFPPTPQIDTPCTTQTRHLPLPVVNTSAPARGFFAPRNRLQDSTTISNQGADSVRVGTDGERGTPGVDQQVNGA